MPDNIKPPDMAKKIPLILASQSPRRKQLLKALKIPFKVIPSYVDESSSEKRPALLVRELARRKAEAVARTQTSGIVLGADTIVVCGREILGKPKNPDDAYQMLYKLSGSTHRVMTGVALIHVETGRTLVDVAESKVFMTRLEVGQLIKLSHKHLDKAGAYAIQSKKDPIAEIVQGDYDNVVGLPTKLVKQLYERMCVLIA
jgi:septum formation protein